MLTVDLKNKKEQISCCTDEQLTGQEIDTLIDTLLDKSSDNKELLAHWKDLNLLSSSINEHPDLDFIIEDRSVTIAELVESEKTYSIDPLESQIDSSQKVDSIHQLEITDVPANLKWFKIIGIGSAITASLGLIVVNLVSTQPSSSTIPPMTIVETYDIKYNETIIKDAKTDIIDDKKKKNLENIVKNNYQDNSLQLKKNLPGPTPVINSPGSVKNIKTDLNSSKSK